MLLVRPGQVQRRRLLFANAFFAPRAQRAGCRGPLMTRCACFRPHLPPPLSRETPPPPAPPAPPATPAGPWPDAPGKAAQHGAPRRSRTGQSQLPRLSPAASRLHPSAPPPRPSSPTRTMLPAVLTLPPHPRQKSWGRLSATTSLHPHPRQCSNTSAANTSAKLRWSTKGSGCRTARGRSSPQSTRHPLIPPPFR
jgi:hypothetical protein